MQTIICLKNILYTLGQDIDKKLFKQIEQIFDRGIDGQFLEEVELLEDVLHDELEDRFFDVCDGEARRAADAVEFHFFEGGIALFFPVGGGDFHGQIF